jgi:hypothetical protein
MAWSFVGAEAMDEWTVKVVLSLGEYALDMNCIAEVLILEAACCCENDGSSTG